MEWSHEIQEVDLSSNSEPRFLQLDQIPALGSIEYCNPTRWLSRHNWNPIDIPEHIGHDSDGFRLMEKAFHVIWILNLNLVRRSLLTELRFNLGVLTEI